MSWARLNRADGVLLGILLVLAVLTALLAWRFAPAEKRGGGIIDPPSTFHNSRSGAKAAYLVLRELGYQTTRLQQPFTERSLGSLEALAVLRPPRLRGGEATEKLRRWVEQGGRLLLIPSRGRFSDWFNYTDQTFSSVEAAREKAEGPRTGADWIFERAERVIEGERGRDEDAEDGALPEALEPGQPRNSTGEAGSKAGDEASSTGADRDSADSTAADRDATPPWARDVPTQTLRIPPDRREAEPLLHGVRTVVTQRGVRFDPAQPLAETGPLAEADPAPLWFDRHGLAALRLDYGQGRVIVLGDSYPLTNIALRREDNAVLLANLAGVLAGPERSRTIAFDEYHMGYADLTPQGLAIVKLLAWRGREWGLAQAAVVALVALFGAAVRFGRPRDLTRRERRHEAEFVEAAGALLDRAGAAGVAGRTLCEHYRRRLCRLTHLSDRVEDPALAAAVHEQTGMDIQAALAHGGSLAENTRADPQRVLRTAQTLYRAMETLEHGAGRGRSHR